MKFSPSVGQDNTPHLASPPPSALKWSICYARQVERWELEYWTCFVNFLFVNYVEELRTECSVKISTILVSLDKTDQKGYYNLHIFLLVFIFWCFDEDILT